MKWAALVLVVLLVGGVSASYALSRPDLTCPGVVSTSRPDGDIVTTPEDALGTLMDGADRVTRDPDDAKGFPTVTYRGYDARGELLARVVVEGSGRSWRTARVDTCG